MPFAEIAEGVWGDDMTPGNRIHQLINRVNHQLTNDGIPLAFTSEGEAVSPIQNWPK